VLPNLADLAIRHEQNPIMLSESVLKFTPAIEIAATKGAKPAFAG